MDNFLRYFYMDIGQVFQALVDLVVAIGNFLNYLLNFPMRMKAIESYYKEFNTLDWILMLLVNLALLAVIVLKMKCSVSQTFPFMNLYAGVLRPAPFSPRSPSSGPFNPHLNLYDPLSA